MSKKNISSVNDAIRQLEFYARIEKQSQKPSIPSKEKPFGKELYERGKKSYFDEYFYGISLENQNLEKIGPFDNPSSTSQFQRGYQRGKEIVSFNDDKMIPEEYRSNVENKHR